METSTVPALLAPRDLADADRPLLTYYDDATGERTELSATALAGWASRTAPLSAGASVVLCANLDPGALAERMVAEGITRVL